MHYCKYWRGVGGWGEGVEEGDGGVGLGGSKAMNMGLGHSVGISEAQKTETRADTITGEAKK